MKKRYIILILVLIGILSYGIYYVNDYYHSEITDLGGSANVTVEKTSNGLFVDGPGNETALIFYPGAKIEYTAYLNLMRNISSEGVDCYLVEMPFNLAFLGKDSADDIIKSTNYTHYVMAGHSLGGAMASGYASGHNVSGLVLLSAYPSDNISIPVLSLYGSNDKILNMDTYNKNKACIKGILEEHVIEGANHAQFANYGKHTGDGEASINSTAQQVQTAHYIIDFINRNVLNV